jgi:TctA family transporter
MLLSHGHLGIFFSNWLVGSITALALFALFWPLIARVLAWMRRRAAGGAA